MITSPNQQEVNALSRVFSRRIALNWESAAILVILLLAIFTRFYMLDGARNEPRRELAHALCFQLV